MINGIKNNDGAWVVGPAWAKISAILSGIISAAFLAWAGVVWDASSKVRESMSELSIITAQTAVHVERIRDDIHQIREEYRDHARKPSHTEASRQLMRLEERVEELRKRLGTGNDRSGHALSR
jgi:hypothetical protein